MNELPSLLREIDTNKTDREINLQRLTYLLASDTEAQEKFFLHDGANKIFNLLTGKNWTIINQALCALSYAASNHNGCKTALSSKKVFNTLFSILHNIQCDNFNTAIYAMFFMSSIMSGNFEAQSVVRQTGCLQYLNNIFSKMAKSVFSFSEEDIFKLFKKTWNTLCSSLVMSMNNPQNYENQVMIGLIIPEAVKILSYLLHNIIQKRKLVKNFEDLLLHLMPVIIFMMLENTENQFKFSLYHGLKSVVNALIKLDKLFYIVPHSEIIVKNLLEVLCVAVNENKDNCSQAGTLGVMSILMNLLFKVKDAMSVLLAMAQLLYDCNDNIKIFIKEGGILVLPTAVKKLNLPSSVINIIRFLQKLCEEHIYGEKLLNSCVHQSSFDNPNDQIKDSNNSVLEVNDDEEKCWFTNDLYIDKIKRVNYLAEKKLCSNLSSETLTQDKNTNNRKYKITNKIKRQKKHHYVHSDVLSDTNNNLSTHECYSSAEVPKNTTPPSCPMPNIFQRTNKNKFIGKKLPSILSSETVTLVKNTNNRKYKITNKFKEQKKQHFAHTDVLSEGHDNFLTHESSLEVPVNITPPSCPRMSSFQRTNENKHICDSELSLFSKSAKSHISEKNTSLRLLNNSRSTETQTENGVLFKTLLPAYDPGVISALYYKTMIDKAPVDNNRRFLNIIPSSKSPQNTKYQSKNKNTSSNINVLTNNKSEIISKQCFNTLCREPKLATLNNADLKRKSDIKLFLDKLSDMEHYTVPLTGEVCAQNLEYNLNINCDHEAKCSDMSNEPLVSDTKVLRHFFSRKSENAIMELLQNEEMEVNKDKMPSNKILNHRSYSLKINSKQSEKSSSLRKNFYRILMEKADTNLQGQKKYAREGKKHSPCVPFSEKELKNLVSGVSKFGLDFKTIRRAYVFHEKRTSKELYLKWKTCFMTTVNDS